MHDEFTWFSGFRVYAYFSKIINLVNMKGYIILCHWRDKNDEETEIINNTVYTSKKKAREAMKQSIAEDIINNSVHSAISKGVSNYIVNKTEDSYEAYEEYNYDNWNISWEIKTVNFSIL